MKSSLQAEALGATGHAPTPDILAQRLADMRQQRVPAHALPSYSPELNPDELVNAERKRSLPHTPGL